MGLQNAFCFYRTVNESKKVVLVTHGAQLQGHLQYANREIKIVAGSEYIRHWLWHERWLDVGIIINMSCEQAYIIVDVGNDDLAPTTNKYKKFQLDCWFYEFSIQYDRPIFMFFVRNV